MGEYYLDKIAAYLRDNSRLSFTGHKRTTLRSRLETRIAELKFSTFADYWGYLNSHDSETARLFDLVTTNETSFFRNRAQFSFFGEHIIPRFVQMPAVDKGTIRVLCAGCSTGEEPYSIAMTILESLCVPDSMKIEIVAGDLSRGCLKEAEAGFYETGRLKNLPKGYIDSYLEKTGDGAFVRKEVKELVRFVHLNLNDLMNPHSTDSRDQLGRFDIIFCRNVMIYFSSSCQQMLVETLHQMLFTGGYLFTGDAEPLHLFRHEFIPVEDADCLIYQKTEMSANARTSR